MEAKVMPLRCPFWKEGYLRSKSGDHYGFCTYRSNGTDYSIAVCPYKGGKFLLCPFFREHLAKKLGGEL